MASSQSPDDGNLPSGAGNASEDADCRFIRTSLEPSTQHAGPPSVPSRSLVAPLDIPSMRQQQAIDPPAAATPPSSPSHASSSLPPSPSSFSAAPTPSVESPGEDFVARPSIFPAGKHAPAPRSAPLEEYYGHGPDGIRHLQLLTELKSSRLEGLYNLAFLVLAFALMYISVRNIVETGFHVRLSNICTKQLAYDAVFGLAFAVMSIFILCTITLSLVLLQMYHILDPAPALLLQVLTSVIAMITCSAIIVKSSMNPLAGSTLATVVLVVLLKLHSYLVTNQLLAEETIQRRAARRERRAVSNPAGLRDQIVHPSTESLNGALSEGSSSKMPVRRSCNAEQRVKTPFFTVAQSFWPRGPSGPQKFVPYPKNVTLGDFLYFLAAPVLVYETSYPRTERIRIGYVAWFGVQSILCGVFQAFLLMQFCVPIFYESRKADDYELLYYIMKLAIPSLIIWLLFFWGFFHCFLNTLAELLRFADRAFYLDWWNSTTLGSFWRKWNQPVHEWCLRHLYVESVSRHKVRARTASLGTFVFSALMHEYVVATGFKVQPFSLSLPYMFIAMAIQVPLISLSKRLENSRKGNLLMWIMLFLGQPLITMLYVRQYIGARGYLMCLT